MQASHQKTVTQEKFVSMANDLVSVWSGKQMQQMKEACDGPTTEPLVVCQNFDAFASMDETHIKAYLPPAIYRACLKVKNQPHLACKSVAGNVHWMYRFRWWKDMAQYTQHPFLNRYAGPT